MKIYTKTGDKGITSLIGGKRVPKHHIRIEAYGTIDELISFIGLFSDIVNDEKITPNLIKIQDNLFIIGSYLANENSNPVKSKYNIAESEIKNLENDIDEINSKLEEIKKFIIPGGDIQSSYCHVIRTICRRAERTISKICETTEVEPAIVQYINRLSDYFFCLGRYILKEKKIKERVWQSKI